MDGGVHDHLFGQVHHVVVVGVGHIELEHRELGRVLAVDAFVAEILGDLVDALEAPDQQALEIQLVGDPKIEGLIKRVVMRREGAGSRAAIERLQRGRLDFEKAPQSVDRARADDGDLPASFVAEQVGVALAKASLGVGETVPLLGRRIDRLRQHLVVADLQRYLTGPGPEEPAARLQKVPQIDELLEVVEWLVTKHIAPQVELDRPAAIPQVGEDRLAHVADGDDSSSDGNAFRVVAFSLRQVRFKFGEAVYRFERGQAAEASWRVWLDAACSQALCLGLSLRLLLVELDHSEPSHTPKVHGSKRGTPRTLQSAAGSCEKYSEQAS